MMRGLLSAILALGLLGSGHMCAWLCRSASSPVVADAHCHEGGAPGAPAPARDSHAHEGCPVCALVAATSTPTGSFAIDLPSLLPTPGPAPGRVAPATAPPAPANPVLRAPPRDVLAITSSLLF